MNSTSENVTLPNLGDSTSRPLGYAIATYTIIVLGSGANFFICFVFAYYQRIRTVNNYFVFNLAISDMLLIFQLCVYEALPSIQKTLTTDKQWKIMRLFLITFETFCGSASIATLTVISYDRYYAVTKPLHYTANITTRKAALFIVCIWLYATAIGLLQLLSELPNESAFKYGYIPFLALCNVVFSLAITLYCYITIFMIASSHLRHNPHRSQDANSPASILTKNLKIAIHILVLVAPLVLCWSAYYTIAVIPVYCEDCLPDTLPYPAEFFISMTSNILATIDPIIYIFLTKDFRKILFGCFRRRNRRFNSETFHLSTTKATTSQASPASPSERRFVEM